MNVWILWQIMKAKIRATRVGELLSLSSDARTT